jgi:hypothetical protein
MTGNSFLMFDASPAEPVCSCLPCLEQNDGRGMPCMAAPLRIKHSLPPSLPGKSIPWSKKNSKWGLYTHPHLKLSDMKKKKKGKIPVNE